MERLDSLVAAMDYARDVGFSNYEATSAYNLEEWKLIDPSIDTEKKLSFAYKIK